MLPGVLQKTMDRVRIGNAVVELVINVVDCHNFCTKMIVLPAVVGQPLRLFCKKRVGDDDIIRAIVRCAQVGGMSQNETIGFFKTGIVEKDVLVFAFG